MASLHSTESYFTWNATNTIRQEIDKKKWKRIKSSPLYHNYTRHVLELSNTTFSQLFEDTSHCKFNAIESNTMEAPHLSTPRWKRLEHVSIKFDKWNTDLMTFHYYESIFSQFNSNCTMHGTFHDFYGTDHPRVLSKQVLWYCRKCRTFPFGFGE